MGEPPGWKPLVSPYASRMFASTVYRYCSLKYSSYRLTVEVNADDIEDNVVALCRELCLSGRCIYSASNDQLLADGYRANTAVAERTVDLSTQSFRIQLRSDMLLDGFMLRVKIGKCPPLHPLTMLLFSTIKHYEATAAVLCPGFTSPIKERLPLRD